MLSKKYLVNILTMFITLSGLSTRNYSYTQPVWVVLCLFYTFNTSVSFKCFPSPNYYQTSLGYPPPPTGHPFPHEYIGILESIQYQYVYRSMCEQECKTKIAHHFGSISAPYIFTYLHIISLQHALLYVLR